MKKKSDLVFKIFGIYFILLSIIAIINAFFNPEIASPLWFCYIAVFFIGVGILLKKSELIITQINIMFIPILFWNIDFFYHLITNRSLWGITDYFFATGFIASLGNFITLQHLYILPISLFFIYFFGVYRKDLWKWSLFEVFLIFLAGLILTTYNKNVNCIYKSCISFISLNIPYYQILWFSCFFIMIFLTNFLITHIFKNSKKRNE